MNDIEKKFINKYLDINIEDNSSSISQNSTESDIIVSTEKMESGMLKIVAKDEYLQQDTIKFH